MGSQEFSQSVRGSGAQPIQTTATSSLVTNNYDNGGSFSITSYPHTIDPTDSIEELIIMETGNDITLDVTTSQGNTITGIPLRGVSAAITAWDIDSITFNDPNGTGAGTYGAWAGGEVV